MSDEHEENLTGKAPLLTDEMKEYERRNVLSNQIRTYFFGADFGTIRQLLAQYKDQQVIEFNTERTALSGEQLEKLEREEQTQNSRYDVLLRLLDRLEYPQIPLTHEDITHFKKQLYSLKED